MLQAFHWFEHVCTGLVLAVAIYVAVCVIYDKIKGNRGISPGY